MRMHWHDSAKHPPWPRSIGAKLQLEKAVGNIGFVYYKTGDFRRALTSFKEAEQQAAVLDSPIDQVRSLNNAGLCEYRLEDLDAARSSYEQSLDLAQSIQNQKLMLDAHVDLGFLLLRLGNSNAAEVHVREANRIASLGNMTGRGSSPCCLMLFFSMPKGIEKVRLNNLGPLKKSPPAYRLCSGRLKVTWHASTRRQGGR